MDEEVRSKPDLSLETLQKQDLSTLSVSDLEQRIEAMKAEIERCVAAIASRNDVRAAADRMFKL